MGFLFAKTVDEKQVTSTFHLLKEKKKIFNPQQFTRAHIWNVYFFQYEIIWTGSGRTWLFDWYISSVKSDSVKETNTVHLEVSTLQVSTDLALFSAAPE